MAPDVVGHRSHDLHDPHDLPGVPRPGRS